MIKQVSISFSKNLYFFLILLASDPFDLLERWFGMKFDLPGWLFWVLLVVATSLACWLTIKDLKQKANEKKQLDSIKTDLININKYERAIANQIIQEPPPKRIRNYLKKSLNTIFPLDVFFSIIQGARKGLIDPIFSFFKTFGDILDALDYGLKVKLQTDDSYTKLISNLNIKEVTLKVRKKKKDNIKENIKRIHEITYGLNSCIILRELLKSSFKKERDQNIKAGMLICIIGLEASESIAENFLKEGLEKLDKNWRWKFDTQRLNEPQLQALFSQIQKLDKSNFEVLHKLKAKINSIQR